MERSSTCDLFPIFTIDPQHGDTRYPRRNFPAVSKDEEAQDDLWDMTVWIVNKLRYSEDEKTRSILKKQSVSKVLLEIHLWFINRESDDLRRQVRYEQENPSPH